MKHSFWLTLFNIVWGSILGAVIAIINDGTRMEGAIMGLLFIIWMEVRDAKD
jgi:flagellar biosynthesis protein FliR